MQTSPLRTIFTSLFSLVVVFAFFAPNPTMAQFNLGDARSTAGEANLSQVDDVSDIIVKFLVWAAGILAFVFMAAIVIAGALFIFSAGEEMADNARQIILYAIIGLMVALLAWVILSTISDILEAGRGSSTGQAPVNQSYGNNPYYGGYPSPQPSNNPEDDSDIIDTRGDAIHLPTPEPEPVVPHIPNDPPSKTPHIPADPNTKVRIDGQSTQPGAVVNKDQSGTPILEELNL